MGGRLDTAHPFRFLDPDFHCIDSIALEGG